MKYHCIVFTYYCMLFRCQVCGICSGCTIILSVHSLSASVYWLVSGGVGVLLWYFVDGIYIEYQILDFYVCVCVCACACVFCLIVSVFVCYVYLVFFCFVHYWSFVVTFIISIVSSIVPYECPVLIICSAYPVLCLLFLCILCILSNGF
jgi:hypothetical protein